MIRERSDVISPLEVARKQVDIIGQYLDVDEGFLDKLKQTKRDVIIHFPVRTDRRDGSWFFFLRHCVYPGNRTVWKGGIDQGTYNEFTKRRVNELVSVQK